jgi:hypothetical protein
MKKLSIFVNPKIKPILKGASRTFAIVLDEAPSSDVTVAFTSQNSFVTFGSSLTFTSGNYNVPQTITITASTNGIVEGYKEETIICTPSGGGYSTPFTFKINICDTGVDYEIIRKKQWYGTHVREVGDITTLRTMMQNFIFNGNGMPTNDTPDSLVSGYTGTCGKFNTSDLTGVTRVDSLTFNFTDWTTGVWSHKVYHIITSATPKNICVIVHGGHGSEEYHDECCQSLLDNGFDVMYCFMPVTQQNTTTTSGINTGVQGHQDIGTFVETGSFNPWELYMYDKIMGLNYLDSNYSYSTYYGTGCSGGGDMIKTIQAIDTRVTRVVSVRGYSCLSGVAWEVAQDVPTDYEVGRTPTVQQYVIDSNYYDHVYLATSGGRRHFATYNAFDTCCLNGFSYNLYKDFLPPKISAMTGGSFGLFLDTDDTYDLHGWGVPDRTKMIEQFLAA